MYIYRKTKRFEGERIVAVVNRIGFDRVNQGETVTLLLGDDCSCSYYLLLLSELGEPEAPSPRSIPRHPELRSRFPFH